MLNKDEKYFEKLLNINLKIFGDFFSKTYFDDQKLETTFQDEIFTRKNTSYRNSNLFINITILLGYIVSFMYIFFVFYKNVIIAICITCKIFTISLMFLSWFSNNNKHIKIYDHLQVFISSLNLNLKTIIISIFFNTPTNDNFEEIIRIIIYDFVSTNLFILVKFEADLKINIFYFIFNLTSIITAHYNSNKNHYYFLEIMISLFISFIFYFFRKAWDLMIRFNYAEKYKFQNLYIYAIDFLIGLKAFNLNIYENNQVSFDEKLLNFFASKLNISFSQNSKYNNLLLFNNKRENLINSKCSKNNNKQKSENKKKNNIKITEKETETEDLEKYSFLLYKAFIKNLHSKKSTQENSIDLNINKYPNKNPDNCNLYPSLNDLDYIDNNNSFMDNFEEKLINNNNLSERSQNLMYTEDKLSLIEKNNIECGSFSYYSRDNNNHNNLNQNFKNKNSKNIIDKKTLEEYIDQNIMENIKFKNEKKIGNYSKYLGVFELNHLGLNNDLEKIFLEKNIQSIQKQIYFDVFLRKIKLTSGKIIFNIILYDITELILIKKDKFKEERKKNKIFAKIAHEFRTPLNSIIGLIGNLKNEIISFSNSQIKGISKFQHKEILKNSNKENLKKFDKQINLIENLSRYIIFLISDVINYSNIDNLTNISVKVDKINLFEVLTFCFEIMNTLIYCNVSKKKKIKTNLKIDENIKFLNFTSDEFRLKQIILNLISNAVKFTNKGNITLRAGLKRKYSKYSSLISKNKILSDSDLDYLEISIIDTGIGMNNSEKNKLSEELDKKNILIKMNTENIERNFNYSFISENNKIKKNTKIEKPSKFKNLDNLNININEINNVESRNSIDRIYFMEDNKKKNLKENIKTNFDYFGEGLGLSICKYLAEKLNLEFKIESIVGQGTNFSLIIPLENKIIEINNVKEKVFMEENDFIPNKKFRNTTCTKSFKPGDTNISKYSYNFVDNSDLLNNSSNYENTRILENKKGIIDFMENGRTKNMLTNPFKDSNNGYDSKIFRSKTENKDNIFILNSSNLIEISNENSIEKNNQESIIDSEDDKMTRMLNSSYIFEKIAFDGNKINNCNLSNCINDDSFIFDQNIFENINTEDKVIPKFSNFKELSKKIKNIIIIADDNQIINQSNYNIVTYCMKELKLDYELIQCTDGLDIIRYLSDSKFRRRIKCIITDENMEFINGSEAITFARTIENKKLVEDIRCISVTCLENTDVLEHIRKKGADCIIIKPLTKEGLKNIFVELKL